MKKLERSQLAKKLKSKQHCFDLAQEYITSNTIVDLACTKKAYFFCQPKSSIGDTNKSHHKTKSHVNEKQKLRKSILPCKYSGKAKSFDMKTKFKLISRKLSLSESYEFCNIRNLTLENDIKVKLLNQNFHCLLRFNKNLKKNTYWRYCGKNHFKTNSYRKTSSLLKPSQAIDCNENFLVFNKTKKRFQIATKK